MRNPTKLDFQSLYTCVRNERDKLAGALQEAVKQIEAEKEKGILPVPNLARDLSLARSHFNRLNWWLTWIEEQAQKVRK